MSAWLEVPRGWLDSFGEIARFGSRVAGLVYSGRVLRFFGESLRQAGILILGITALRGEFAGSSMLISATSFWLRPPAMFSGTWRVAKPARGNWKPAPRCATRCAAR